MNDLHALQPLNGGIVLIVGAKASNFDETIRNHPRVVIWNSQQQHWTDKELPANTRAVFTTRWVGHVAFSKIYEEAKKKKIIFFNHEGTGQIAKQVRELLVLHSPEPSMDTEPLTPTIEETPSVTPKQKHTPNKLKPLLDFIDWDKNNMENGRLLMKKSQELGISSTLNSITEFVRRMRKLHGVVTTTPKTPKKPNGNGQSIDVSVEILDGVVNSLKDIRNFLLATVDENTRLKTKIERLRKMVEI
jgi:hypothetical protein